MIKRSKRKTVNALISGILALLLCFPAFGAQKTAEARNISVLSVTDLSGNEKKEGATINKGGSKDIKAVKGMKLGEGYTVATDSETVLYFQADADKAIKMDAASMVTISKASSSKLTITLNSGEIFFNIENKLPSGSSLSFKAGGTAMSVRGTSAYMKSKMSKVEIGLFKGEVDITTADEKTYQLLPMERASVLDDTIFEKEPLTIENGSPFGLVSLYGAGLSGEDTLPMTEAENEALTEKWLEETKANGKEEDIVNKKVTSEIEKNLAEGEDKKQEYLGKEGAGTSGSSGVATHKIGDVAETTMTVNPYYFSDDDPIPYNGTWVQELTIEISDTTWGDEEPTVLPIVIMDGASDVTSSVAIDFSEGVYTCEITRPGIYSVSVRDSAGQTVYSENVKIGTTPVVSVVNAPTAFSLSGAYTYTVPVSVTNSENLPLTGKIYAMAYSSYATDPESDDILSSATSISNFTCNENGVYNGSITISSGLSANTHYDIALLAQDEAGFVSGIENISIVTGVAAQPAVLLTHNPDGSITANISGLPSADFEVFLFNSAENNLLGTPSAPTDNDSWNALMDEYTGYAITLATTSSTILNANYSVVAAGQNVTFYMALRRTTADGIAFYGNQLASTTLSSVPSATLSLGYGATWTLVENRQLVPVGMGYDLNVPFIVTANVSGMSGTYRINTGTVNPIPFTGNTGSFTANFAVQSDTLDITLYAPNGVDLIAYNGIYFPY